MGRLVGGAYGLVGWKVTSGIRIVKLVELHMVISGIMVRIHRCIFWIVEVIVGYNFIYAIIFANYA